MIAFVTSFRARALAQDWQYHVWLLERTVQSMLAQKRGTFCVVVVCHDIPDTRFTRDPLVHFLSVDFDPPARNNDDMCVDKVLKLSVGAQWARSQGCDYVVFNDADDLVSNQIGGFVEDNHGKVGWYCASEMFYRYGGRLVRLFDIPESTAGPCVIVRADLLTFATPPFTEPWTHLVISGGELSYLNMLSRHDRTINVLAAVGLGHYRKFMTTQGHPLAPLPFPANVVINHPDSTSFVSGGIGSYYHGMPSNQFALKRFLLWTKQRIHLLPSLRVVTPPLRREFSIPPNNSIPSRYRTGSILWR